MVSTGTALSRSPFRNEGENKMDETSILTKRSVNRRSLLKGGLLAGGAAIGAGMLGKGTAALAQSGSGSGWGSRSLNDGDIAILRFLAAAELIESDLWTQYAELGGIGKLPPNEVDPTESLNAYQNALSQLDGDGPQYISSNTLDEISHATFLNAYLVSKGADPVDFSQFQNLQGSKAFSAGAQNIGRLTNLLKLNVDTSWFTRYRSKSNPDLGGGPYPQAVTINNKRAIPATDSDLNDPNLIQVIANIAAFHFGYIEQGGSSLYAAMSRKASGHETLHITLGIGGDEIAHFLEWVDFAGNACQPPVSGVSAMGVTFPNLFTSSLGSLVQPSLIFPVPAQFISADLPLCATIRPVTDKFAGARATIASFTADGLFIGQSKEFLNTLHELADEADDAVRRF